MPLVPDADVRGLLPGDTIPDTQLAAAGKLVAGWLREDTGGAVGALTEADDLYSAALELIVLVVTNPELLSSKTVGPTSRSWPLARQRDAIRAGVRSRFKLTAGQPTGSFPDAYPWPDSPVFPAGGWR